jgi:glucose-6-phosphate 1-epimerase
LNQFRPLFALPSLCAMAAGLTIKAMQSSSTQSSWTLEELNRRFAIEGAAEITAGQGGLPKVHVSTAAAQADIYLHGAHVTSWRPAGAKDVIFLSERSHYEDGRAIRGGVPVCFPWFRAKADDPQAPAHGFVRIKAWEIASITRDGDVVTVTLSTENDAGTRRWWPYDFRIEHRVTVGAELKLELIVTNTGTTAFHFEEALHTYHRVGDAEKIRVAGLDGATYLDNTDGNRKKTQQGDVLMAGPVDNAYLNTTSDLELADPAFRRHVQIAKENSHTTIVWNPWESGAKAMADLGDDEWRQMACIEASNILDFAVPLAPGEQHTMSAHMKVLPD